MNTALPLALGAALGALGVGGLAAPSTAARMYGIPTDDPAALAYVRAAAARDLTLGGILISCRGDRRALARICFWMTLIALADAALVYGAHGVRREHAIHLSGAAALMLAAIGFREGTDRPERD